MNHTTNSTEVKTTGQVILDEYKYAKTMFDWAIDKRISGETPEDIAEYKESMDHYIGVVMVLERIMKKAGIKF